MTESIRRPRYGHTYYVRNVSDSTEWALVTGSHYGMALDPEAPRASGGAAFTSPEMAARYVSNAAPGTTAARPATLCRAQWLGGTYWRIVSGI